METVKKQLYYDSGEKLKEFYQLMEKGHWLYIIYLCRKSLMKSWVISTFSLGGKYPNYRYLK